MSVYGDAIGGLQTVLQNGITGVKVYNWPADDVHQFPAAVILPEPVDAILAFRGNTFTSTLRIVFMVSAAESPEAFTQLWDFIDPVQVNKSVIKAVRDDRTLNGKVDDADVVRIENIGRRQVGGGFQVGFDALVEFVKTVA